MVFNLIEKAGIACDAVRKGWIQPAPSAHAEKVITARMQQWQALSAPVEMLDKTLLKQRLGTAWYRAAWLDRRGGSVNPLAYTRGLASAAIQAGVSLFTQTPVTGYRQNSSGEWQVSTPQGSVTANQLVLASNAYVGQLSHSLRKTLVPVRTAQIASEPLADEYWQSILPQGEAASDASHLLTSFRITPDKRLVMGGAYATGGDESMALFNALKCAAQRRFPQLSAIKWVYQWSGYLAITPPHLPQIYQLAERCYAPIGCNGRGIAMSTMTGKQLAGLLTHGEPAACAIPVVQPQPRILHPLRHIGISTQVIWASIKDKFKV
ncbi:MAG: FAD-dependent oxidoreductase [Gammaproteobacteria bacterium]|nr:MAG: FAD-dependent oxidoreductase [Gammaproteobacteria bacterium]